MKLFVINGKRKIVCLLVLAGICLLMALTAFHEDMAGVFASKREIPVYSVETDENLAALTFDCAWGADDIPQILDTLKKVDVRATFFMVGQWAEKIRKWSGQWPTRAMMSPTIRIHISGWEA